MTYPHRNSKPTLTSRLKTVGHYAMRVFAVIGICATVSFIFTTLTFSTIMNYTPPDLPERMILVFDFEPDLAETVGKPSLGGPYLRAPVTVPEVVKALDYARKDPRIAGFVARIQDSQYSVAQIQELRDAILRFQQTGNRFARVFSENYGGFTQGTGQYYLAAAFDEIWLQPVGMVAATGLSAEVPFAKAFLDKLGVKAALEHKGKYKSTPESLTRNSFSAAHKEMMQNLVTDLNDQLVAGIAQNRGISAKGVQDLINQAPLMADAALESGLVDRIGYFDVMVDEAKATMNDDVELINLAGYLYRMESEEADKGILNVSKSYMGRPAKTKGPVPKIALITGAGTITSGKSANPMDMTAERITRAIRKAAKDDQVKAIVFRMDSPGGSPSASETIHRALIKAKEDGKKVVVSMGATAASGGYWVATAADKIIAQPGTYTGSIGVFAGKFVLSGLWQKLGIRWGEVSKGTNADMWSANSDYSRSGAERLQRMMDMIYDAFLQRVADGRNLPLEDVAKLAEGYVYTGRQAKEVGLVDELGGLQKAIHVAKALADIKPLDPVKVEAFPPPKTPIEILVGMAFGSAQGLSAPRIEANLPEELSTLMLEIQLTPEERMLRLPLSSF